VNICTAKDGSIICDQNEVLTRWNEYFDDLLNKNNNQEHIAAEGENIQFTEGPTAEETDPPTPEELEEAIKKLKNNKAPGADGITAELFKQGGTELKNRMFRLILRIWADEELPREWNFGIICPILKKGDPMACSNYRGILLLNTAYKILSYILYARLSEYTERIIGKYQCGFRKGKSTTNQIFTLSQIMEKTVEYQIGVHHLFIDFKSAYDSIYQEKLLCAMMELGIPPKLIRLVKTIMTDMQCSVQIQSHLSEPIYITRGVRQGNALACLLFNIALEKVIWVSVIQTRGTIFFKTVQLLAYADDIDLMARTIPGLSEAFLNLEKSARNMGLVINEEKTVYMYSGKDTISHQDVAIGNYVFKRVDSFKYLGTMVNKMNNRSVEVNARLTVAK
jgi:sorting nexin-29